jgi:two-component system copper resistance phosphate regulon response regulator CusR
MRILVIEDEAKTAAYIRKGLIEHGHVVDIASNGVEGLFSATARAYDLVLLDVMLPGLDGWKVFERLRALSDTRVLFLTARDEVEDRVRGLQLGADDYLIKPFAFSELLARIQNIFRRQPAERDTTLRLSDLEVDPLRRRVLRAGARIQLTAQEFTLLEYLVRHAGQICSRTVIAESVWDMNFDSDTNVVDVAVRRLRAKVDDPFESKLIHTIRGVGYVLEHRDT